MPTISKRPITTPPTELRSRPNHDVEVVSVKVSLISGPPKRSGSGLEARESRFEPNALIGPFDRDAIGSAAMALMLMLGVRSGHRITLR